MQVEQVILLHPASFTSIYEPRWVNNVYFDTSDLISYHENAGGFNRRTKYRLRWYGSDAGIIKNGIIEIKEKDHMLGWKEHIAVPEIKDPLKINEVLLSQGIIIPNITPSVQNRYFRKYFLSADGKFRITIDTQIGHKIPFTNQSFIPEQKIVLEIKFDKNDEGLAKDIFEFIPFRQKKNSKYAKGIELTM
jgi:SPX domain protein involved in polyphosphate accumulation